MRFPLKVEKYANMTQNLFTHFFFNVVVKNAKFDYESESVE